MEYGNMMEYKPIHCPTCTNYMYFEDEKREHLVCVKCGNTIPTEEIIKNITK
jgi:DNA-directed RNA polymerase subunit M/transcription elongation factor TFIIS